MASPKRSAFSECRKGKQHFPVCSKSSFRFPGPTREEPKTEHPPSIAMGDPRRKRSSKQGRTAPNPTAYRSIQRSAAHRTNETATLRSEWLKRRSAMSPASETLQVPTEARMSLLLDLCNSNRNHQARLLALQVYGAIKAKASFFLKARSRNGIEAKLSRREA